MNNNHKLLGIMVRTQYILAPVLYIFTDMIEKKKWKIEVSIILDNPSEFWCDSIVFLMLGSYFIFLPNFPPAPT